MLGLTLVSTPLAGVCKLEVWSESMVGSDHYPVMCVLGDQVAGGTGDGNCRWVFGKADWNLFKETSDEYMRRADLLGDIDKVHCGGSRGGRGQVKSSQCICIAHFT